MKKIINKISDIFIDISLYHRTFMNYVLAFFLIMGILFSIVFINFSLEKKMLSKYQNCTFELIDIEYSRYAPHYIYKVSETNELIDLTVPIEDYNF